MSALMPFLTLDQPCDQVQTWVSGQLTSAGFRVVQTFDLQDARLAHSDCPCPHHGTDHCNCQMIVLMVYQKQKKIDPATLLLHGQDGRTWLSMANPNLKRASHQLEAAIKHTLIPHPVNMPTSIEAPHEV